MSFQNSAWLLSGAMKMWKNQTGQALVLIALCLAILVGFMGLAIDIGLVYRSRQNVQIAADAAATAAALDYYYNQASATARAAGLAAATSNGFTDGREGAQVTVNLPPVSGPMAGTSGFAEALVSYAHPTNFLGLFGFPTLKVTARSVAGDSSPSQGCVWLMDPTGTGLELQGSYDIEADCGIFVNSSGVHAIRKTGAASSSSVNAKFLDVMGEPDLQHAIGPTPVTSGAARRTPPFTDISSPAPPSDCSITSAATAITTANVSTVSGYSVVCFSEPVTLQDVSLPGAASGVVYLFQKGVSTTGTVNIGSPGAGAVLDIYGESLNQGNAILNVYAPTDGVYNSIAILQPASNSNMLQIQFGTNTQTIDGYIVAPAAEVYLQDNGGCGATVEGIVAFSMFNKTSSLQIRSYDREHQPSTPNRAVTLVE